MDIAEPMTGLEKKNFNEMIKYVADSNTAKHCNNGDCENNDECKIPR